MKPAAPLQQLVAGLFPAPATPPLAAAFPEPQTAPQRNPQTAPPPGTPTASRRRKVWELEAKQHCPLIGTCLPMEELARFARRFQFSGDPRSEFELHVEAVSLTGSRTPFAEALQRHLDRKYAATLHRFDIASSVDELTALWQAHYRRGEIAGPLWAALSHRCATKETRQQVYGDLHMLSHQVGAGQAADARKLTHLTAENAELRASLERERRERASSEAALREQLQALAARNATLHADSANLGELRARLHALENGVAMTDLGRRLLALQAANDQLRGAAQRVAEVEARLARISADLEALRDERDQLAAERDALEQLLAIDEPAASDCRGDCRDCPAADKPERCVLCVGGRTTLLPQYRQLAERLGIRLLHHDGGLEEALSRLPDLIHAADAVICPTDCVSHSAYYQLKRQCKRSGKPCLLFKGAGVSGFAVALTRLTSGEQSLAGAAGGA